MTLHSSAKAAEMAGVTYRQLDYWCRFGIMTPARTVSGSGGRRGFSDEDVRTLRALGKASAVVRPQHAHDVLVATATAAHDHAGFDDVWVDLGGGVSLVIESPMPAVAS